MGMSSRAGRLESGRDRVTITTPSPAETAATWASRALYRWELLARRRVAAASAAVRGDPSEKVTPRKVVRGPISTSPLSASVTPESSSPSSLDGHQGQPASFPSRILMSTSVPPAITTAGRSSSCRMRAARKVDAKSTMPNVSVDTMYIVDMLAPFISVSESHAVPL